MNKFSAKIKDGGTYALAGPVVAIALDCVSFDPWFKSSEVCTSVNSSTPNFPQTFYQLSVSGDHKFGEGLWLVVLAQGFSWSYSPWELEHMGAVCVPP